MLTSVGSATFCASNYCLILYFSILSVYYPEYFSSCSIVKFFVSSTSLLYLFSSLPSTYPLLYFPLSSLPLLYLLSSFPPLPPPLPPSSTSSLPSLLLSLYFLSLIHTSFHSSSLSHLLSLSTPLLLPFPLSFIINFSCPTYFNTSLFFLFLSYSRHPPE